MDGDRIGAPFLRMAHGENIRHEQMMKQCIYPADFALNV